MFTTTRKLLQIKGLSEAKVNKIKEAAKAMESADFLTGTELREKRAEIMKAMRPRPAAAARDAEPRSRRRSRPGPAISTLSSAAASRPPALQRSSASSARASRSSATRSPSRRSCLRCAPLSASLARSSTR